MGSIAVRNLWERKLRTALTAMAIVLGVMMVSGTYVLTDTIDASFEDIFNESNEGVDAVITAKEFVDFDDGSVPPFDAKLLETVRRADGVAVAAGGIADPQVAIIGADDEPVGGNGAPTFAFSASGPDRFDPLTYVDGDAPDSDEEIVIDKATADSQGFELGDQVTLAGKTGTREYTLAGIATLGEVESFGGATMALLTLAEARRLTGKQGQFDQISVAAEEGTTPERLASNLEMALPSSVQAETGAENSETQQADVGEFVDILKTALLIFAGVALFVATFLIFNTFSITVAQRTREFAMLRTLGASRRQILGSVVLEALAVGLGASAIGILAGLGFAPAIEALFNALEIDLPSTGTVIAARTILVGFAIGTGVTVLAALIPALRATRVPPVTGLREGVAVTTPRQARMRSIAGVALTGLGVAAMLLGLFGILDPGEAWIGVGAAAMFLGVALLSPHLVTPLAAVVGKPLERLRGVAGRLARENAIRNPGRTAATAAALMIGLALVSFVAVFAAGLRGSIDDAIDKTLIGDLIVSHEDGFSDIPAVTADAVARIEGVNAASPYRFTQNKIEGIPGTGYLSLVDPQTATGVLTLDWREGSDDTLVRLGANDAVIDEGWGEEEGFAVGDEFTARTASGEPITYTVRGTFKDATDFIGDYAASDANARAYGEPDTVSNVFVALEEGADSEAVRADIDEALAAFPTVEIQNQDELKDSIAAELNTMLGVVYALLLLSVIVSLFGIVNTLALSIHERIRELGLLRAVGTSRSQVRRIVRYEAVITALIGGLLGGVLGVVFAVLVSRPLADEGFILSIPVGTLVILSVLTVLAGILAAIGPARRASRLDVLEALAYE